MNFTLGFSPCPNDCFIFDALVHKKIDTQGIDFTVVMEDVEALNNRAFNQELDITKLSYGVLPLVLDNYAVLNSGSALGRGVGPLLITKDAITSTEIDDYTIAIPGEQTTAHLLFSLAFPTAKRKLFLRYDEIENFVAQGKGLGVIIHENRFTYQDKGLKKIMDLGNFWEKETGSAIPLGGIVIKRKIATNLQKEINTLIKKSIEYAFKNYASLNDYIRNNAQEMSEAVIRKHIDLYVNKFSLNLGREGKISIKKLLKIYQETNNCIVDCRNIFIN